MRASDIFDTKHVVQNVFNSKGWKAPRWANIFGFFFVLIVILVLNKFLPYMGWLQFGDFEIFQNLPDFWTATGAD